MSPGCSIDCTYKKTHTAEHFICCWFWKKQFHHTGQHYLLSHNITKEESLPFWHHAVFNSAVSSQMKSITYWHCLSEEGPWAAWIKREKRRESQFWNRKMSGAVPLSIASVLLINLPQTAYTGPFFLEGESRGSSYSDQWLHRADSLPCSRTWWQV